ncbi:hypothetical protein PISMIDRAFT_140859 [Pisolithus microcarpus 441]|uniref:Uncharacterized protein n=1 Tax=Pisolithus microcarpus 441 TaxID=765257 RepID=A0A0C9ZPV4_9AGAM|nr:hypothetical protein PISMIDRAFT_140859 [Pisolithus microcarpus 441]
MSLLWSELCCKYFVVRRLCPSAGRCVLSASSERHIPVRRDETPPTGTRHTTLLPPPEAFHD